MQDEFSTDNTILQFVVRCPDCYKSYSVDNSNIYTKKPTFKCQSCECKFWVPYPDVLQNAAGVIGFPVEWEREYVTHPVNEAVHNCPKCAKAYLPGQAECAYCGVLFAKFKENFKTNIKTNIETKSENKIFSTNYIQHAPSVELQDLWENIVADYENIELHQNFISRAMAEQSLAYAASKYALILELAPHDEFAKQAQKEIAALAEIKFESSTDIQYVEPSQDLVLSHWHRIAATLSEFRSGFSIRRFKVTNLIMVACGFMIAVGVFLPHMRNLVGFGTSVLFFILILRYYFRAI